MNEHKISKRKVISGQSSCVVDKYDDPNYYFFLLDCDEASKLGESEIEKTRKYPKKAHIRFKMLQMIPVNATIQVSLVGISTIKT